MFLQLGKKKFMLEFRLDEERAVEDIAQLLRERKGGGGPLGEQLALSDAFHGFSQCTPSSLKAITVLALPIASQVKPS